MIVIYVIFSVVTDQTSDSPCSLAMKETMDQPNPVLPTSRPPTTAQMRVKALNKSPSIVSGGSRKLSSSTSEPFSYRDSHSGFLQQHEDREKGEGDEKEDEVDDGELEEEEEGRVGGHWVLVATVGSATNSRIRKGQDKTALAKSSNSLPLSSSNWKNHYSILAFATVFHLHS